MNEYSNKHYITLDANNIVIGGFSDAFRQPQNGDICINDKGGYQFRLFPDGEENPALYDFESMIPLYRWTGSEVVRRSEEEIEADRAAIARQQEKESLKPTQLDRIESQVTYTAMMTDTLLEE